MIPISMMQMQLRSNIGLILHHAKRELYEERQIKQVTKRLKKYNPKIIDKLNEKYIRKKKDSNRFNQELAKIIDDFLIDYTKYRNYFQDIIKLFKEANIATQRQQVQTIEQAKSIMDDLIRRSPLKFTKKARQQFINEYVKLIRKMERMIKREKNSDVKELHKKRPQVTFFKRISSEGRLTKNQRKQAIHIGKDYMGLEAQEKKIIDELEHGVRQDFLILLLRYIRTLEEADINIDSLQQDIKLLLDKQAKEYDKETKTLVPFLELIKNDPEARKRKMSPETIENDINTLSQLIDSFLKTDWKDESYIKRLLEQLDYNKGALEGAIQAIK